MKNRNTIDATPFISLNKVKHIQVVGFEIDKKVKKPKNLVSKNDNTSVVVKENKVQNLTLLNLFYDIEGVQETNRVLDV